MLSAPLSELVVQVLYDIGSGDKVRWSKGTGFVISSGRVLTTAHMVGPGELLVRLSGDREFPAHVLISGNAGDLDLAILEVPDLTSPVSPPRYGIVDRDQPWIVKDCWAIGFPRFKESFGPMANLRNSMQVMGQIHPAENLGRDLLMFHVSSSPTTSLNDEQTPWAGMSGAAVFAEDVLIGVIREHHPREGVNVLGVLPIAAINRQLNAQTWWNFLGSDSQHLVTLSPSPKRHEKELTLPVSAEEIDEKLVFVIASFLPDMEPAFEAIQAAAAKVGLRAQRVKDVTGDYKISDKMLMMIRQARFIEGYQKLPMVSFC